MEDQESKGCFEWVMNDLSNGFYISRRAWNRSRYLYINEKGCLTSVFYNTASHNSSTLTNEDLIANDWFSAPIKYKMVSGDRLIFREGYGPKSCSDMSSVCLSHDSLVDVIADRKSKDEIRGLGRQILTQMGECDPEMMIGHKVIDMAKVVSERKKQGDDQHVVVEIHLKARYVSQQDEKYEK